MQGARIGPYTLLAELGAGGMGTVWRAAGADGTVVALKVVHAHLVDQPGFRERFLREAKAGLSISSAHVVRTIECLETVLADGRAVPALVLEFVEGRDLAALLDETKRVPEDLCRHLGREIARGLEAIHAAGIVHRDLKPGNVLLTSTGGVKVMDLGLARQASGEDRMSQTGLFLGTAAYAPPEQFFGKRDLDPRSDLYSLGAMLFEMATGRVPFESPAIGDLVRKVLRDKAPRIGAFAPQVTPFFEEVVATLLEKQPERRFASAAELGAVLEQGEAGDWWGAAAARLQAESRRPLRRVRVQRETELWGREDDLAELRGLWDAAKSGEGAVLLLEGEAGIGKTRLVEELLAAIEAEDDAQILVGRHDPAGAGAAAEAVGAAFRAHLGSDGDLAARLHELLPGTPLLIPAFAALLQGTAAPEGAMALTAEAMRAVFSDLACALAREAPLVLVVDDLHFATDDGRALFRTIANAVEGRPVLLVGTARPGLPASWIDELSRRRSFTRREVTRLDEEMVRTALVRHLGAGYEAESVAGKIASQAGGNPYFIVEALRHLGEHGAITRTAEGTWRVTGIPAELTLPATVRELVARRLASLTPADREVLEVAACQGHEFDGRLVAETLGRQRMEILRTLGRLEHATRLVRAAGARFSFDHHVVHEVLYAAQADDARRRRHAAIANALEVRNGAAAKDAAALDGPLCADLCAHFLKGGEGERARRYLDPALTSHEKAWRNHAAIELAEHALAAPGLVSGEERGGTLLRLATRLGFLARRERQGAAIDEALALARARGDVKAEADALGALGNMLLACGSLTKAQETVERQIELSQQIGDRAGEAVATRCLGLVLWSLGRFADAKEKQERAIACAREQGDENLEAASMVNLGLALWQLGRLDEAKDHFERAIVIARRCGNRLYEANAIGNLGLIYRAFGRFEEALAQHDRHRVLAREIGDRRGETLAEGNLGRALWTAGRGADARASRFRHLALARETGDRQEEARALANLGALHHDFADLEQARRFMAESLDLSRELKSRPLEASALEGLSTFALDAGEFATSHRLVEEALTIRRETGNGADLPETLAIVGERRRRVGDVEGARAALEEAITILGERAGGAVGLLARASLANLPGADTAAADAAFDAAGLGASMDEALMLMWQATGKPRYLIEAKRRAEDDIQCAPEDRREAMRSGTSRQRAVLAAAAAAGI